VRPVDVFTSLGAIRKKELQFSKKLIVCGILVSISNLFSMYLMFYALDALGAVNLASMGFSLAISASLAMFTLYSIFILREKCYAMTLFGLLFIIAGGLLISVPR
jgi:drug/metabolite transporter (DMT)-like permease